MTPSKLPRREGAAAFGMLTRKLPLNGSSSGIPGHLCLPFDRFAFVSSKGFAQVTLAVSTAALVVMEIAVVVCASTALVFGRRKTFMYSKLIDK